MKMTAKAFAKKLFGTKYERLTRAFLIDIVVFWGLYIAGYRVRVASSVGYFMVSAFTAGVMWQALSSKDNAVELRHMLMLPYQRMEFVFSYVAVLLAYAVVTKAGLLLAALFAVSDWNPVWNPIKAIGMVVCMVHAALMAAAVFSLRKYWYAGIVWAAFLAGAIFLLGDRLFLLVLLLIFSGMSAVLVLCRADAYVFYEREGKRGSRKNYALRQRKKVSIWRYFFRYFVCHKNYMFNTVVMWCIALVLPYFLKELAGLSVMPMGFALLSLNTPICILLSCDRALEQAVRFLPGQKNAFCIPYCLFIFLCNMAADVIFCCSWQIQNGGVTAFAIAGAVFFALQSAVWSVLLEWHFPIRGWKIESDLWHHPRKYAVPCGMLLIAGAVAAFPALLPVLLAILAAEIAVILFIR